MLKGTVGQEITVNRSVYTCFDVVDACITDEIAVRCCKEHHNFGILSCSGQLNGKIDDIINLLTTTFELKEYSRGIHNCIFPNKKITRIHLANDYCFVHIHRGAKSMPGYALEQEDDADTYFQGMEDNNWDIAFGSHKTVTDSMAELFGRFIIKVNEENRGIYCLTQSEMGLRLHHIGYPGKAIIPTNYSIAAMESYDRIVAGIQSETPSGYLSIISGPPGSGKTFMVKGVIGATEKESLYIMIPASLVSEMSGPSMIPLFVRIKEEYLDTKQNVVFILEDADQVLVPRGSDNISSVSALLNCSDGILGSLFNMRFICTTNANALDFDPALTRPGRLSCRLEIGALNKEEAITAYNAITKTTKGCEVIKGEMTLAEVYALANGNDYTFSDDKKVMGF